MLLARTPAQALLQPMLGGGASQLRAQFDGVILLPRVVVQALLQ
jgi:hypothetical protein